MNSRFLRMASGAALLIVAGAMASGDAGNSAVSVQVSPEVKATIDEEVGPGAIKEIKTATDKDMPDKPYYVVEATINGSAYEIKIEQDGSLISTECTDPDPTPRPIPVAQVPAAAMATLQKFAGGVKLEDHLSTEDELPVYETHVTLHGHQYLIRVDADGKLLSKEFDDDNDENHAGKSRA